MSMETGALNVSQTFGVSAYRGRLAMEILTCVNNLQSRCDMLEDASAILGCAACCSGIESASEGLLLDNHLRKNYSYTNMLANAVDGQPFLDCLHSSSINDNIPFFPSNVDDRQLTSDVYAKRLRKRPAGFLEEDTPKKRGKANHLNIAPNLSDSLSASGIPTQPQRDKEKLKAAKPRKGKDSLISVKVEDEKHFSKSTEPRLGEESDEKTAALEWKQCVSLLKSYGVIGNPDLHVREMVNRFVPHPGRVGDGLLPKMCKICGMAEDANSTVICDGCQEAFHLFCCVPRLTSKYFKREDNWFCASCRKQRRKIGSKPTGKESTLEDQSTTKHVSKVRLGPAHQADVPEWHERALEDDAEHCVKGCIGMEMSLAEDQKNAEGDQLLRSFNARLESLCWLPADNVPPGVSQNWVKCNNVIVRGFKTSDGRRQNDIVCGKWRRAPLNVEQTNEWECFCAIEWDPLHADCAIPQECTNEEVFSRMAHRLQISMDLQAFELGGRKATLRHGKLVL